MTTQVSDLSTFSDFQIFAETEIHAAIKPYLDRIPTSTLKSAMTETLRQTGKQLRPMLVYATGFCFDAPMEALTPAAAAIELIHTYSLIHDDLPCMDDADLRRGKPTCHKQYGEAMAVLIGDALLTLSTQLLASSKMPIPSHQQLAMISTLTKAAGAEGMIAGQVMDIHPAQNATAHDIEVLHQLKTGALIHAAITLGSLASFNLPTPKESSALNQFAHAISLAFQIQDDLLDVESNSAILGKTTQLDQKHQKPTYPILVGIEKAKEKVALLYQEALESIATFQDKSIYLEIITKKLIQRAS